MANNLAKIRGRHGLTQESLGKQMKLTKAGICYYEKHKIGVKAAKKASDILETNVFEILGTDALKLVPQTEEDKKILISIIENL